MMTGCSTRGGTGAAGGPARHIPVLRDEVVTALAPHDNAFYIDGTFGAGGYARAVLDAAECTVLGIDKDPSAVSQGKALQKRYGSRLRLAQGSFADMERLAREHALARVDGIALDLGVSSMQLEEGERGFSFQAEGPLDMRMSGEGPSAADVVNRASEAELARIIGTLGEERRARAIAKAIVAARANAPLERTSQLADLVAGVLGRRHDERIHPATRTFQALRIFVNRELEDLVAGLLAAERMLKEGGRLAVVTFHSLEDRIVKRFFASRSGRRPHASRHLPPSPEEEVEPSFRMLYRRAIRPGEAEVKRNPRARSARLRAGERTAAAAMGGDGSGLGLPRVGVALTGAGS